MKTNTIFILDKSGSMSIVANSTIRNFNEQIQQMKENSKDQEIFCSLVTFNGDVYEHIWNENVSLIEEADENTYRTLGSTALYDAIGYCVNKAKETYKNEDPKEIAHLVYILSDGEENASKKYTQQTVSSLLKSCDEEGNWTFCYMGCSKEQVERAAKNINIPLTNCAVWSNANEQCADWTLRKSTSQLDGYFKGRASGQTATKSLYSTQGMADFTEGIDMTPTLDSCDQVLSQAIPNSWNQNQTFGIGISNSSVSAAGSSVCATSSSVGVSSNLNSVCKGLDTSSDCSNRKNNTKKSDIFLKSKKAEV